MIGSVVSKVADAFSASISDTNFSNSSCCKVVCRGYIENTSESVSSTVSGASRIVTVAGWVSRVTLSGSSSSSTGLVLLLRSPMPSRLDDRYRLTGILESLS